MARAGASGRSRSPSTTRNAVEPGLLLFAAFVVRRLAEDAATVASSGSSVAATG
jgi:hypothetical protein